MDSVKIEDIPPLPQEPFPPSPETPTLPPVASTSVAPAAAQLDDSPAPTATSTPVPAALALLPEASPAPTPAPEQEKKEKVARKPYGKRNSKKKIDGLLTYTTAFVPGTYNVKIPAGDYLQKERNVDVARQMSLARAKKAAEEEAEAANGQAVDQENPLSKILVIHPGSRNLRIGRASDFYPQEVPNCIARRTKEVRASGAREAPAYGSRAKREREEAEKEAETKRRKAGEAGGEDVDMEDGEAEWSDPVDESIGYLRDYLRNRLVQERLATDWREGNRVKASNAKVKPEALPEHNDPHRIDWTEPEGKSYFVGTEALRLPESAGYTLRYPILQRSLNLRDWTTPQSLLDDISTIITHSLSTLLSIPARDHPKYSVVFIVPDHGDRVYVQEMTGLLLNVLGFKAISVQQEAYCAIFGAGMSSACVVDIGAQVTSVTCVDEGLLNADTRIKLAYGGDDITSALTQILQKSNFPYRDLDLSRAQEWLMMDSLKIKICTLEEHLVANTPWDFYLVRTEGLTQKYVFRTYDENILAPLVFFDTRLIDFKEKKGEGTFRFWNTSDDKITDELTSPYEEPTGAMRASTTHLLPAPPKVEVEVADSKAGTPAPDASAATASVTNGEAPAPAETKPSEPTPTPAPGSQETSTAAASPAAAAGSATPTRAGTPTPGPALTPTPANGAASGSGSGTATTPLPPPLVNLSIPKLSSVLSPAPALAPSLILSASSHTPLDAAITSSISLCGTENKIRTLSHSILLIGGSSSIKGLSNFIAERLPGLMRQKGLGSGEVMLVPPPRGLNPRFVSWKGACVMCSIESLEDMWIRRDEWEAVGVRALKDRYGWF
ncbi:hypothetical protein IAT38_000118 [Cryptococcus sp. DSM 104549]